jgi:hypothetical protein
MLEPICAELNSEYICMSIYMYTCMNMNTYLSTFFIMVELIDDFMHIFVLLYSYIYDYMYKYLGDKQEALMTLRRDLEQKMKNENLENENEFEKLISENKLILSEYEKNLQDKNSIIDDLKLKKIEFENSMGLKDG